MKTARQTVGAWGETVASRFLEQQGYHIVAKNYRIKRGELDIVAWHKKPQFGKTLCFVEVKTRSGEPGSAERATNHEKLASIYRTARLFCLEHHISLDGTPIQFEQVSVYTKQSSPPEVTLYVLPAEG